MSIIGTQTGIDPFLGDVRPNGKIKVVNPNDENAPFEYKNFGVYPAFFKSNKIVWPRLKPPEMISLVDTATSQFMVNYGMSYLSFYFYMRTDAAHPALVGGAQGDYDNLFINSNGYMTDIELQHSKDDSSGGKIWEGTWQHENVDIRNIKGNLCQVDMTVSKQVIASQVVDKTAYQS
jgi:hypothetical protein|tara:strand:- start:2826 stop:3356 length:531 start_codon:yes stop_codon:yes gene_type:complete